MNLIKWLTRRWSVRGAVVSLYKRGMRKADRHDQTGAANDYTAVIQMRDAPMDVVAMAVYNRALLLATAGDAAEATEDLTAVLAPTAPLRRIKSAARLKLERMQHGHHAVAAS